jgi:hypothetical protein
MYRVTITNNSESWPELLRTQEFYVELDVDAAGTAGPAGGPPGSAAGFGTNTSMALSSTGAQCTIGEVILRAGSRGNGIQANGQLLPHREQ